MIIALSVAFLKNATDSAMIIDAMDVLYGGNVDGFVLSPTATTRGWRSDSESPAVSRRERPDSPRLHNGTSVERLTEGGTHR